MKQRVRIVVCGDDKCGKTSLITCLLKERFDSDVPSVLPEISLPAQVTVDNVHTIIQDTMAPDSAEDSDYKAIAMSLKSADVICLCYAVDNQESFQRLSSYWLPLIQSHTGGTTATFAIAGNTTPPPIIIVGTKVDLRSISLDQSSTTAATSPAPVSVNTTSTATSFMALDKIYLPLMNRFREIETCIECSAKQMINIPEVFYFASKAVLYPSRPLFDSKSQRLLQRPIEALTRIFNISDCNKDGLMDDEELNAFQKKVFGSPLQQQELESVKDVVRRASLMPSGIRNNCLTRDGFIYLHSLFVQRGRLETIWTVLRKFGYGDNIELRPDFLVPKVDLSNGCSTELSSKGYQFLTDLFQAYDQDKDGALNEKELKRVFETTPGNPWLPLGFPNNTITNEYNAITLQGFLAMFSMTTLLDYKTTLAYLAYLGYDNGPTRDAIKVIYPNRLTSKKGGNGNRNVFQAYVFGATGSGKTELLKCLVNKPLTATYSNAGGSWVVVNSIEIRGTEKYLVVQEVAPSEAKTILDDKSKLRKADVLCFVYDTSDANSFSYIVNLREQYDLLGHPVIFIGTKTDRPTAQQQSTITPEQYAEQLGVAPPLKVSVKERSVVNELFGIILGVAINPRIAIPSYSSSLSSKFIFRLAASATAVAGTLLLGGLWYMKLRRSN